jgi:hypothetical protein
MKINWILVQQNQSDVIFLCKNGSSFTHTEPEYGILATGPTVFIILTAVHIMADVGNPETECYEFWVPAYGFLTAVLESLVVWNLG